MPNLHTGTTWGLRWSRRAVAIPLVTLGAVIGTLLSPALLLLAGLHDLIRGRRRWPTPRLMLFLLVALWLEVCAVVSSVLLWIGFVGRLRSAPSYRIHSAVERWWIGRLVWAAGWTIGLRFEVTGDVGSGGPVIAIGRHASHVDAFLPAWLLGPRAGFDLRYVIAVGLTWLPAFSLFGYRLPNHFVNRGKSHSAADLAPIRDLAATAGARDAIVIFPEGQFFTPERHARALKRITDPVLAASAAQLRHLLPPRPAGVVTLLDATPQTDVVVINHVGLEGYQTAAAMWRNLPFTQPIRVQVARVPAADIPRSDAAATIGWLTQTWQNMDNWIHTELSD